MNKSTLWWIVGIVVLVAVIMFAISSINPPATPAVVTYNTPVATTTPQKASIPSESHPTESVFAIAGSISGSSQFAALLSSTGVGVSMGTTTYTVFVPTDAAFNKAPKGYVTGLTAAQRKRLIQYHIVIGRAIDTDATDYGTIQASSKDALNFSAGPDGTTPNVNSSNIIRQYKAKNGIVYVIDAVLIPPIKK